MNLDTLPQHISEFCEQNRQRPRAVRIFEAVSGIVDRGRDHLRAWESLRNVVQTKTALADLAPSFFILTGIAHIEAATLHASKLTDKQPDSANVTYLLNTIEADRRQSFVRDAWPKIKGVIMSARLHLREIDLAVRRIKEKRDRELAHLDRRQIDMSLDWQAIEIEDLRQVFDAVDAITRELATSATAFAEVRRFLLEDLLGPGGFEELIYFTSAGFDNELVKSPSTRAERIREFDRHLREAESLATGNRQ